MQFVPGGSIANLLARFGALEEEVFCNYTKQILEGVEYLHNNNVIHRCVASVSLSHKLLYHGFLKQESPAVTDKPAQRLRKVCTVYVRAVGL